MRNVVLLAVTLSLALGGCGDKEPAAPAGEEPAVTHVDPVEAPTPEGTSTPVAGAPADADPATGGSPVTPKDPGTDGKPAKEKGGDEEFYPPSNWCGTPTMEEYEPPLPEGDSVIMFINNKGEVRLVPQKDLTAWMREQLHDGGWRESKKLDWKSHIKVKMK